MKGYVKPCTRGNNPDHVIIHAGANEFDSERQTEIIERSIIDVARSTRTSNPTASVSGIVLRNDNFNNKALDVNDKLSKMYRETQLDFITHKTLIRE